MSTYLPMTQAHAACLKLMESLEKHRCIDFDVPENQRNPQFVTDYLFSEARGKMFGILLCKDSQGNLHELRAFSSQYNGSWSVPNWVGPVFEPEEFSRMVEPVDSRIKELDSLILASSVPQNLEQERRDLSQNLMKEIHQLYEFTNSSADRAGFSEVWKTQKGIPNGAGDCCTIKLLNHAHQHQLKPVSLAEFFWGKANSSGTRQHGYFYPPCVEKCQPLLQWMYPEILTGWPVILYKDDHIAVVEKPADILSVPGKGPEKQDSVSWRIRQLFPEAPAHPEVHRLDMETSGLMVFGLTPEAQRELSMQFQNREISKKYYAVLEADIREDIEGDSGIIELSFRLDPDNRPYQVYDEVQGKEGITRWKKIGTLEGKAVIEFRPHTGRTHQLRLHAAHEKGLGSPIDGDNLYGNGKGRLKLHAASLGFCHPIHGEWMKFDSDAPFLG
jgi:tRNA pseudouridine32 synthase/23S rRNA pseudouridine746 synthase